MVLESGDLNCAGLSAENFCKRLRVTYPIAVQESRQLCIEQNSGNVFCSPNDVSIKEGDVFRVRLIDTMGTMESGRPYVEVLYGDGYILESPLAVEFVVASN
jgi:hypothetical protein